MGLSVPFYPPLIKLERGLLVLFFGLGFSIASLLLEIFLPTPLLRGLGINLLDTSHYFINVSRSGPLRGGYRGYIISGPGLQSLETDNPTHLIECLFFSIAICSPACVIM